MMPATWLIVWDIIIGIWAAWFIALVIISIAQSMWQSRDGGYRPVAVPKLST